MGCMHLQLSVPNVLNHLVHLSTLKREINEKRKMFKLLIEYLLFALLVLAFIEATLTSSLLMFCHTVVGFFLIRLEPTLTSAKKNRNK